MWAAGGPVRRVVETFAGLPRSRPVLALERLRAGLAQDLTLEIERGAAFLLVPVFIAAGVLIYFRMDGEPHWLVLVGGGALFAAAVYACTRGTAAWFASVAALMVMLGLLSGKVETWRAGTKVLGGEISTRLTGTVAAYDALPDGRVRLTIDVTQTQRPTLRYAPDRVRVIARAVPEGLAAGATISGVARLRPPPGPVRPGSYDFSFEGYFDGIGATGFFLGKPEVTGATQEGLSAAIENARQRIAARIRDTIGGAEGEIAAALMVGVRAGIPEEASEALRRTGLYHVISISGLHMALVAGTVIGAIRAVMALFPMWAARHPVRKYAAFAGLVAITAYLVISGGEVATRRSFLMLSVMLVALLFDRAALTMRNLAISAIVVLLVTPHEVVGPSFQMSFAATAALVGAFAWWTEWRATRQAGQRANALLPAAVGWPVKVVTGLALTSLVAGLATAVYGAYHFQRVSPLSLFANLVAMPVVSVIVVPCALMASLAMPFGLDAPFLKVMGYGLTLMLAVARWFSERSPLDATGLVPGFAVVALTVALVISTVATTRLRLAALPFAAAGLLALGSERPPDLVVAEDARLLAFRTASGELAVNRARPNAFTAQSWMRAFDVAELAPPLPPVGALDIDAVGDRFVCDGHACAARHPRGDVFLVTEEEEVARNGCDVAAVILLTDSTSRLNCDDPAVLVLTTRDLARYGSASIHLPDADVAGRPKVEFAASPGLNRPWHRHRAFSREARGLPPWRREQPARAGEGRVAAEARDGYEATDPELAGRKGAPAVDTRPPRPAAQAEGDDSAR